MGILKDTHEQFIEGSAKEAIVQDKTVYLCYLTNIVRKEIRTKVSKVYVTTRMLKHIYDKRPAEEYEYLINNLHTIVKYPDSIYCNLNSKRGDYCMVKKIGSYTYFSSIEILDKHVGNQISKSGVYVATAFRLYKENYLKKYNFVWSWKGDIPSS
ncbi:hypothetical protein KJ953_01050 [Patescibacteria group bacterium]|nr:hypothetical protein [Patescibacteria group bacterium]MBU1256420.1 hypothetical protein [Patescibacteria group bacterium]